jgi:hypothetical protein
MVKIIQNHSILIFLVLPLLVVLLIHGSYSFPNTYAADQSPEDICPLGVPGQCSCQTNIDGTASCCTTDSGGNQFCSKCDYDASTGKYTNCQSVPSGKPYVPPSTHIPTNGGVFQNMPSNPGTSGGNNHGNINGGVFQKAPLNP